MNIVSADPVTTVSLAHLLLETESRRQREELLGRHGSDLALVKALKEEVDRLKNADSVRALKAGMRAFEAAQVEGGAEARALGAWAFALGLTVQGRFEEALTRFDEARRGFLSIGQDVNGARVGMREVQALAMTGNYDGALTLAGRIREVFEESDMLLEAGQTQNNIGAIYTRLGRIEDAEQAARAALALLVKTNDQVGIAQTHVNLGYACQEQDRFREARDHFQQALEIFQKLALSQSIAGTLLDLALLYRREGRLDRVLELLAEVRGLYQEEDAGIESSLAQLEEARVHLDLNLLDEAETLAEELVATFERREMQLEALEALTVLGNARARAGRVPQALEALERAKRGWFEIGNANQAAWVQILLATINLEQALQRGEQEGGPYREEARTLAAAAVDVFDAAGVRSGEAAALLVLAQIEAQSGNEDVLEQLLGRAEELVSTLGIPDLSLRVWQLLGRLEMERGEIAGAEERFARAIGLLESVRSSLPVDDFRAAYFGDRLVVYGDMVAILIAQGRLLEALTFAERSKARALLDLLAGRNPAVSPSTDPAAEQIRQELETAREELNWHYLAAERHGTDANRWALVTSSERRVTELLRQLERYQPPSPDFGRVTEGELEEFISTVDDETDVLVFFTVGNRLLAFLVSHRGIRVVEDLGLIEEVSERLGQLDFALSRVAMGKAYLQVYGPELLKKRVDAPLRHLYRQLITPLQDHLAGRRLIVVPHAALHGVPFAALQDDDGYLIDRTLISYAPSLAVYRHCLQVAGQEGGHLAAFGVPVDDIPEVRHEVDKIIALFGNARRFLGAEASLENFFVHAPRASLVHIATHGVFRPDNPMFSGLRFSDGWLAARDLYQLRLQGALVVLSACETGVSSHDGGDELMGLARGFLNAGSPTLTVSQWPVKDGPTAELMIEFYLGLAQGISVAESLRAAQLALRERHPNPYYWSGFAIIGDPWRRFAEVQPS